jgi:tRNA pseudouridine32 synthase/23S rRNA pseudouridine746 synthase
MPASLTPLAPQPPASALPARLASPFRAAPPHPLALRAAEALQARLAAGALGASAGEEAARGKMFGVLVVQDGGGRVGFLAAFSGMLAGSWRLPGFAPPLFDEAQRDALWPAWQAELRALEVEHRALTDGEEARGVQAALDALVARHAAEAAALRARHAERRALRHAERQRLSSTPHPGPEALEAQALEAQARERRAEAAEREGLAAAQAAEREALVAQGRALGERRERLEQGRAEGSRALLVRLFEGYVLPNARGETRPLLALHAPEVPPGGAGDCAAPKLFGWAYREGLRPLALAEFWWGAAPPDGSRRHGAYYPACRSKCGRVLPFMLEGLDVEPAPEAPGPAPMRIVHEDPWLLVVDKPCGLLTVPGRHAPGRDSVQVRLQARAEGASGTQGLEGLEVVHKLEPEVSGLLLVAKDAQTHAHLSKQSALGEAELRYVALLEGAVSGGEGTVALPLASDVEDRARQRVDAVRGKRAVTRWRVLAHEAGRTRVELEARTGRTHQLRVHAADPRGLGAPIVGDALYGTGEGPRLLLHAERLSFTHPQTGERVVLESPAPF